MTSNEGSASAAILIVDDTEANLLALEAVLEPLNVRMVAARSGLEALKLIETTPFAIALLDVQMPGMDGFELAEHARRTKLGREMPIIFVTAVYSDESCVRRGYASGAVDYITKPYDALIVRARVKAFVDLYEQREAVRRGQEQQQVSALNEILDTAPAYVAIVNSETLEYLFANPMLRELFQAPLVGSKLDEQDWGEAIGPALGRARATSHPTFVEELSIRPRGGRGPTFLHVNLQPLRNGDGAVDRLLLFATDITAQVSSQKQLERTELERARLLEGERHAREAAELASLAKDEFLATVSHELRTPLSAILGWSSLARSRSRADVAGALDIIERNARAQARVVEDVLEFSAISRGKMRLSLTQVELRDVARAAIESVQPAADAKNICIEAELDASCGLLGDPGRLQQVIWNLLNNAVKYTGHGGRVRLSVESRPGVRRLSVVDNGQGIEADFLPYVFEAFRQANGSTTRRHGGLGLGLAIVNQIVQAHGGTIEAHSDGPGRGARFAVELPAEGNPTGVAPHETQASSVSPQP